MNALKLNSVKIMGSLFIGTSESVKLTTQI